MQVIYLCLANLVPNLNPYYSLLCSRRHHWAVLSNFLILLISMLWCIWRTPLTRAHSVEGDYYVKSNYICSFGKNSEITEWEVFGNSKRYTNFLFHVPGKVYTWLGARGSGKWWECGNGDELFNRVKICKVLWQQWLRQYSVRALRLRWGHSEDKLII